MSFHLTTHPTQKQPSHLILTGDQYRAQLIAETLLTKTVHVNKNRGLWSFTGTYKDTPIMIQSTGMGTPSTAIVLEELFQSHPIKSLIRLGTCCSLDLFKIGEYAYCNKVLIEDGTTQRYINTNSSTNFYQSHFPKLHNNLMELCRSNSHTETGTNSKSTLLTWKLASFFILE
jgi:uridine phosphorylase